MLKYLVIRCGNCHFGAFFFRFAGDARCCLYIGPAGRNGGWYVVALVVFFLFGFCCGHLSRVSIFHVKPEAFFIIVKNV